MPRVDERVLGRVVERIGEHHLLDAAAFGWVLGEPARRAAHRLARGHDVAVAELLVQPREVEHAVRRRAVARATASAGTASSYGIDTISSSAPSSRAHSSITWRTVSTSSSPMLKIVPALRSGCSTAATTAAAQFSV